MSAFLKIDHCMYCNQAKPWEWVPAIAIAGKALAGTGVWRSQLIGERCMQCDIAIRDRQQTEQRNRASRASLLQILGGPRPFREFTFEHFRVAQGNQLAFTRAKSFRPNSDNLYLWGDCGVGKTHLAYALARAGWEAGLSVSIETLAQLVRKSRMKEPEQEQAAIDRWVNVGILLIDELGKANDTAYSRQILQEILDRRAFQDRGGLVVTSQQSLDGLTQKTGDDAVASRLAGICSVIEVRGTDQRLVNRRPMS